MWKYFVWPSLIRVRVQRPDDVLEVCPTILTEDSMQAQHLGATLALYNLVKGQVTHAEDSAVFLLCLTSYLYSLKNLSL